MDRVDKRHHRLLLTQSDADGMINASHSAVGKLFVLGYPKTVAQGCKMCIVKTLHFHVTGTASEIDAIDHKTRETQGRRAKGGEMGERQLPKSSKEDKTATRTKEVARQEAERD
ncbi:hypothetical protein EDD86DRAFT_218194 [Gorgonomyces haynaldii]|nr:hypothetical protein EDD86DRAFT_218194 [Gorgonomyces haynaldii]